MVNVLRMNVNMTSYWILTSRCTILFFNAAEYLLTQNVSDPLKKPYSFDSLKLMAEPLSTFLFCLPFNWLYPPVLKSLIINF